MMLLRSQPRGAGTTSPGDLQASPSGHAILFPDGDQTQTLLVEDSAALPEYGTAVRPGRVFFFFFYRTVAPTCATGSRRRYRRGAKIRQVRAGEPLYQ